MLSFKVEASVSLDDYRERIKVPRLLGQVSVPLVIGLGAVSAQSGNWEWASWALLLLWLVLRWPLLILDAARFRGRKESPLRALADLVPFLRFTFSAEMLLPGLEELIVLESDEVIVYRDYLIAREDSEWNSRSGREEWRPLTKEQMDAGLSPTVDKTDLARAILKVKSRRKQAERMAARLASSDGTVRGHIRHKPNGGTTWVRPHKRGR